VSVKIFNEGDHKQGLIGILVKRRVAGIDHVKYFPFRRYGHYITLKEERDLYDRACKLDLKWQRAQLAAKKKRDKARLGRNTKFASNTDVLGVSAYYRMDKRCGKMFYTAVFKTQGTTDNCRYNNSFQINKFGFDGAWTEAVKFYAKQKGIRKYQHLIDRKPDMSIFKHVAKHLKKKGHTIPAKSIPK